MNRREVIQLLGAAAIGCAARESDGAAPAPKPGPMTMKKIPSSGEAIPVIGMGTWQTFDVGNSSADRASLTEVLREFAQLGGKLIDSSPMYGSSEAVVGDLAQSLGLHSRLFMATKVWTTGRDAGISQMQASMQKLRTPKIDLMQVHNLVDVDAHMPVLKDWKKAGRIRYDGVTHYHDGAYDSVEAVLERHTVDFLQINYSVAERGAETRLLPLAQEKGIAVIANRPFASGGLFRALRGRPLPSWASEIDCTSWAQILLKLVVSHPAVTCAIPATSKVVHLRDNMGAGVGRMPDAAMRARILSAVGG